MGTTPVSTEYNSNNNIVNQTQGEESFDYKYENTANSHLATSVEQAGIKMEFTYNTAGALTGNRITSVNGNAFLESDTLYTSDKNYATGIEDVNGVYTYYHYSNGLLNYVRNEKDVQTNYTYYAGNDRQKSAYISDLVEVNYKYAKGMLSQIIRDAGENSTADTFTYNFTYDDYGNTTKIQVGTATLVTYTYEPYNGKLIRTTYGNGTYIENVYDELDRIIGIKVNGVTKYRYAYNGNGDLYEVEDVDNNITVCYNYDSLVVIDMYLG
jgi:YD repeat-containing protein